MYGCSYRVCDLLSSQGYFRTLTETCFSPAAHLQINLGEAHVIRNAGGSAYVELAPFKDVFLSPNIINCFAARKHLGAL